MSSSGILSGIRPNTPPISCYVNFVLDESKFARIRCAICALEKGCFDELEAHIAWDHMKWTPYQCGSCPAVFRPTDYTLRVHMQEVHPNEQQRTLYMPSEEKLRQLKATLQSCIYSGTDSAAQEDGSSSSVQQRHSEDQQSKSSDSPRISPGDDYFSTSSSMVTMVGSNSIINSLASSQPPSIQSPLIPTYPLNPHDFSFSFNNSAMPALSSQVQPPADVPAAQVSSRKRPGRSYGSGTYGNSLTCYLCQFLISPDEMSQVTHVFQHLKNSGIGARYMCGAQRCRFGHYKKESMIQHCKKAHSGNLSFIQDRGKDLTEEYEKMKTQCFPQEIRNQYLSQEGAASLLEQKDNLDKSLPTGGSNSKHQRMSSSSSSALSSRANLRCNKCNKTVRRELILRHVYEYHLSEKPLKCPYCPYATGYLLFNLRHHVSNCHSDKPMTLIDEREKFQPEVFRLRAECFPMVYHGKSLLVSSSSKEKAAAESGELSAVISNVEVVRAIVANEAEDISLGDDDEIQVQSAIGISSSVKKEADN